MKVTYDMQHYLTTAVEAYQKVCITATGKRAALKTVATPFVEEDQLAARAKAPHAQRDLAFSVNGAGILSRTMKSVGMRTTLILKRKN